MIAQTDVTHGVWTNLIIHYTSYPVYNGKIVVFMGFKTLRTSGFSKHIS